MKTPDPLASDLFPDLDGLVWLGLPGTDEATTEKNFADTPNPATVSGTPSYGTGFFSCTSLSGQPTFGDLTLPASASVQDGEDYLAIVVSTKETSGALMRSHGTNADAQDVALGIYGGGTGPTSANSLLGTNAGAPSGAADGVWPTMGASDFAVTMARGQYRGWPEVMCCEGGALGQWYADTLRNLSSIPRRANSALWVLNPDPSGGIVIDYHLTAVFRGRIPSDAELLVILTNIMNDEAGTGFAGTIV